MKIEPHACPGILRAGLLLGSLLMLPEALAAPVADADEVAALRAQVALLQSRLDALEAAQAKAPPGAGDAPAPSATAVTMDRRGLTVQSPDRAFSLRIRPRIQVDGHWFPDAQDGKDEVLLRRVRPTFQGTAGPLSWRFTPELAGTARIIDAWGDLGLGEKHFLRAGKFKGVVGLERLQAFSRTLFIERGLPSVITPTRETGVEVHGGSGTGIVEWTVGVYNGVLDDTELISSSNLGSGDFDAGARLALYPWINDKDSPLHGLRIGLAATQGRENTVIDDGNSDRRIRYRTSGRNTFFRYNDGVTVDGERIRFNAFMAHYQGPFGFLAEWVRSRHELGRAGARRTVDTDGWTAQAGWVITGESASQEGVRPRSPFAWGSGHWGAFEAGLRYHQLRVADEAFAGDPGIRLAHPGATAQAAGYGVALNWYLTDNLLAALNYEVTDFSGPGARRPTEEVLLSRFQIEF